MYDFVAIGDITIDMYFKGDDLTEKKDRFSLAVGGKYYTDYFHQGLGGSAANVAIHAAVMGLNSAPVAIVGENAFKNIIVQGLVKKTASAEFLHFERDHISISSILLTKKGERTVIKYSDPKEHIHLPEKAMERVKKSEIVFMGNLPDVSLKERYDVMKSARSEGNVLAINYGMKDCEKRTKNHDKLTNLVDVLILNKHEYAHFVGNDPDKVKLKNNQYKKLGIEIPVLVVTDGSNGVYAYTSDDMYHKKAEKVKEVVDATGAGDAFTTAFLKSYQELKDIDKALENGTKYAAKILTKVGAN